VRKYGRNGAICLREEAIFVQTQKCPYHVTLTLSTCILDAGSPGDHLVQVWSQSSHLSRIRSDFRKKLQTDDGRRAIMNGFSSNSWAFCYRAMH